MRSKYWDCQSERVFEREQARERAKELANCLVHEASRKIETTEKEDRYRNVFLAFAYLGWAKAILGSRFEEIKQELYEKTKEKLLAPDFPEEELRRAMEDGLRRQAFNQLPTEMGEDAFHYGFVAEMFSLETYEHRFGYSSKYGWADIFGYIYEPERGLKGFIYKVMREKVLVWRERLVKFGGSPRGEGGWLEKLEKSINDPDWLSKVEELLIRVDYFGVDIYSDDDE